jgi:membrane protein implicated in regulation of membrane protease activity
MLLVVAVVLALVWLPLRWAVPLVLAAAVVEVAEAAFWIRISRRRRPVTGAEALVGAEAVAVSAEHVRVDGELWRARFEDETVPGDRVVIVQVEPDLALRVRRGA